MEGVVCSETTKFASRGSPLSRGERSYRKTYFEHLRTEILLQRDSLCSTPSTKREIPKCGDFTRSGGRLLDLSSRPIHSIKSGVPLFDWQLLKARPDHISYFTSGPTNLGF